MEVYSRVVGYYRPVQHWNDGKREEFKDRKLFQVKEANDRSLNEGEITCRLPV